MKRNPFLWLFVVWSVVQWISYERFGILISIDSELYLSDAKLILQGEWPVGRSVMYLSYSVLLAFVIGLCGQAEYVVVFQLFASALAMWCVYKLAWNLYKNEKAGLIAALCYICWIKVHQWNFVLYTDSLFCSLAVITFTAVYFAQNRWQYALVLGLFLYTVFLRPNGIGFGAAILGYMVVQNSFYDRLSLVQKLGIVFCGLFLFLSLINVLLTPYIDSFIDSYARAEIIYPNRQFLIAPVTDLVLPDPEWPPLLQIVIFGLHNPIYFSKLVMLKSGLFLANVKPYFSWAHNLLIVTFLYPVYWFAYRGFKQLKDRRVTIFITIFVGLQIAIVGFTSENWDGRFLLPILPFTFILAAKGIQNRIKNILHGSFQ